jgi:lipopolysaccharide transport system ATP-binding protein
MSETVINVEHLSKRYVIGVRREQSYTALRDVMADRVKLAGKWLLDRARRSAKAGGRGREEFWALKDVSFEIGRGEVVGIIGRNGAGKSTLLKVLSRITEPTSGRARVKGRLASLLEVGTGFHPELTGRENIFLNGSILGMRRAEIKEKFDAIVAFAEVEKFLDVPVKRYSSGMYVRLAFAVAAHLEPDSLIVDEVLAVGDAQFQKKCLGKMAEVSKEGRAVLFVSHNMAALQALCTRVIRLKDGEVAGQGGVKEQIESYLNSEQSESFADGPVMLGPNLELRKFEFEPNPVGSCERQRFTIEIVAARPDRIDSLVILFHSALGQRVAIIDLRPAGSPFFVDGSPLTLSGDIRSLPLVEGEYHAGLYLESREARGNFIYLSNINVLSKRSTDIVPYPSNVRGVVELDCSVRQELEARCTAIY